MTLEKHRGQARSYPTAQIRSLTGERIGYAKTACGSNAIKTIASKARATNIRNKRLSVVGGSAATRSGDNDTPARPT